MHSAKIPRIIREAEKELFSLLKTTDDWSDYGLLVVTAMREFTRTWKSPASVIMPHDNPLVRNERQRCKFNVDVRRRRSRRVAWRQTIRLELTTAVCGFSFFFVLFGGAVRLTDQLRYRRSSSFSPSKVTGAHQSLSWMVQVVEVTREGESRDLRGPRRGTWEGARHASTFEPSPWINWFSFSLCRRNEPNDVQLTKTAQR